MEYIMMITQCLEKVIVKNKPDGLKSVIYFCSGLKYAKSPLDRRLIFGYIDAVHLLFYCILNNYIYNRTQIKQTL